MDRRPIRLLDPNCVERIAAGEVLERPASAVKELVENALDAGATKIRIGLRHGGLSELSVEDDGHGILVRELPLVLERHATSKISGSGDLSNILSFGFRGEAMASIASVSRMTIRTRSAEEEVGGRIDVVAGRIERREPITRNVGTTVVARELFYNVPVRKEFMKSAGAEKRAVAQTVTALALAHPSVGFRLESDDVIVIEVPANEIAIELGNPRGANMVALGAYLGATGAVPVDEVVKVIRDAFAAKPTVIDVNIEALHRGFELGTAQRALEA